MNSNKKFSNNKNKNKNYKQNNNIKIIKFNSNLFFYLTLITLLKLSKQSDDKLYVSIDFGNSKTSYAYTINNNINNIKYGPDFPFYSEIILYKKDHETKNLGTKSFKSFINYNQKERDEVVYIRNLKMNLFNYSEENKSSLISTFPLNYRLDIESVISSFLKHFSDYVLEEINSIPKYRNKFSKDTTKFVLTMPKIWDEQTQNLMKNCAKKVGMKNIIFLNETEASLIAGFEEIENSLKNKRKKILVINLGAQNIEMTIYKIQDENGSFKQISNSFGGDFGSFNINKDILEFFKFILGESNIEYAKKNYPDEYLKILEEIENKKKYFKGNEKFDIEFSYKLTYDFPFNFLYKIYYLIYNEKTYKKYKLKFNENKIFIPGQLMKEIFEKRVKEIIDFINSDNFLKENEIDHIILTGGFSNCELLVNAIKKNIPDIPIYILMNPENSVLKGALIYNIYKDKIHIESNHQNPIKKYAHSPYSLNVENFMQIFLKLSMLLIFILIVINIICIYQGLHSNFCQNMKSIVQSHKESSQEDDSVSLNSYNSQNLVNDTFVPIKNSLRIEKRHNSQNPLSRSDQIKNIISPIKFNKKINSKYKLKNN